MPLPTARRSGDLSRGGYSTFERCMHGAVSTLKIGSFAGKKDSVVYRLGQGLSGFQSAGPGIAVGTARKWILAPIVIVNSVDLFPYPAFTLTKNPTQRPNGAVEQFVSREIE